MSAETGKKLSGEMILEAMEYIDDALIEEADAFRRGERRAASDSASNTAAGRRRSALRWVTLLAACVCVVAILGRSGILQRPLGMGSAAPSSAPAADSAAAVAPAEESTAAVAPAEEPAAPAPAEAAPAAVDEGGAPAAGGAADSHTYITAEEKAETQGSKRKSNSEQFSSEAKTEAAAPSEAAPEAEEAVPEAEQAALTGAQESAQYDADAAEETMETVVFDDGTRGIYAQVFLSAEETERLPQSVGEPLAQADGTVWYGMEGIDSAAFLIREEKTADGVIYTLWERRE